MLRNRIADFLTVAIEALVAILVLGSVWPFGSVQAVFQMLLLGGVGIVLVLWAIKAAVLGRPIWKPCLLVTLVAAFCCVPILQATSMSPSWIGALAPGNAQWLHEFRPPPADIPGDPEAARTPTETLSFDAGETRDWLFRLIGFAALFVAIRNNLTAPASAIRFAWLCVANAALLAIVGIGQMTSSPENMVYWKIPTEGSVFGPFICRNHAAYVLNLGIGLAFGLLLGTRAFLLTNDSPSTPSESGRRRHRHHHRERPMWAEMLRDPKVAWLLCGIGICVAGLIATLSRGGAISLLAAGGVGLATLGGKNAGRLRWMIVLPIVAITFCFLAFSGFERVTQRWDKLVDDAVTPESRAAVWSRTAPLIGKFPVFGSGWGTFIEVEPTTRKPGDASQISHDYAHNDFLQLWIEGGTLQLAIAILLIVVLFREGFRAIERHRDSELGRLALGAMVGLAAVVFHSFVDFGLHIPAVAVLTVTVAAFLANLADHEPTAKPRLVDLDAETTAPADDKLPAPRPFAMVFQVAALLCVAGYLSLIGYRQQQAERYRIAERAARVGAPERRVPYLEAAVSYAPEMWEPHFELAVAYMDRAVDRVGKDGKAIAGDVDFQKACPQIATACRLSPLSFDAQDRLRKAQLLVGDTAAARRTVDRLTHISPSEPEPWFLAGRSALKDGDESEAIRDWRNCLLGSSRFLPEILVALNKD
ncbi:MAG TPA: O-antigen ligase family protein, partial [Gemmataceae bacterium]|nr:O-antigen ligase family protein [Gemmataceae bacterium]